MKIFLVFITFFIFSILLVHSQSSLIVHDTRNVTTTPDSYIQSLQANFKTGASVALPDAYYTILGLRGWVDNTGGKTHELAFSSGSQVLIRSGYSPLWENWRKFLITDINGNVGVGVDDTKGYKLAVAGGIIAESMKVQLQGAWPDFVFKKDYILPSLDSISLYIKQNGHLPNIPSEEETRKNGVDLGILNARLLEKIEELTLHLIEIKKDVEKQKNEFYKHNAVLVKEIELLKIYRK